jgi:hypothetical protein
VTVHLKLPNAARHCAPRGAARAAFQHGRDTRVRPLHALVGRFADQGMDILISHAPFCVEITWPVVVAENLVTAGSATRKK